MKTIVKGATIISMNPREEIIANGTIIAEGSEIDYVGPEISIDESNFDTVIDGKACIVLPGLVNAHNHSMSHIMKAVFINYPLEIWRQYVKAGWSTVKGEGIYLDVIFGCLEMLRNGITTSIDHFTNLYPKNHEGIGEAYRAVIDSGIRGVLAPMISDLDYEKTVPIQSDALDDTVKNVISGISAAENTEADDLMEDFLQTFIGKHSRFHCMLGPAAPQRCSKDLLLEVKRLAQQYHVGIHIHVLESKAQFFHTKKIFDGKSAISYMKEIGFLGENVGMAHVIWVDENDIDIIADSGASVIHNPVSNLRLGDGIAPVIEMKEKGVNIALGTDGPCSNDGQNLLETMKVGTILHTVSEHDFKKWITPKEAVRMATIRGAKALGIDHMLGSLEKGKKADMVLINKRSYPFVPKGDIYNQLVMCEFGRNIEKVIVDGQVVVDREKNQFINENKIFDRVERYVDDIREAFDKKIDDAGQLQPILEKMYYDLESPEPEE
jgi:5-methylthioadenosine/S-adenosylhomocysteine deaminase